MSRVTLSIEELNQMVRAEMRKHEGCANVSLKSVYWHEPDMTGCNWDVNMWEGDVEDALACKECIIDAIKEMRARYNLLSPE
jgi:hypothetical protein